MLSDFLIIVWLHFLGDFVLQNDRMARGKSKSNFWLGLHCVVYAIPFLAIGGLFAIINAALHAPVDYISSRVASKLYNKGDIHNFFVIVGLDQAIHLTVLFTTYTLLIGSTS